MSALGSLRQTAAKASVNLRGDLAKLSDAELAERLDAAWQSFDAADARKDGSWLAGTHLIPGPWRGPLRHPRAYRFLSALSGIHGGGWMDAVVAAVLSRKKYESCLRQNELADAYLSLCEVRDIMDEIKRRLAQRSPEFVRSLQA